uniref:DOMON domain-containing protein n=1 Tax=Noctiluca scintillans TaxID=2966 RepID=A0A7S1F3L0_NOCSC|mmetsp:Transcript_29585/g.78292  ORF Transcript_29585/g.78292 Transcript_29585/m.78292 type:complete len:541 (+) Transcript_29585:87-1709(+)
MCWSWGVGLVAVTLVGADLALDEYIYSAWPLDGVRFYWRFVEDDVVIASDAEPSDNARFEFAITAPGDVWIGFGVGEPTSGSMPGADIMLARVDSGTLIVGDYFSTDFARPEEDCFQPSDWVGQGYEQNTSHTTVAVSRRVGATDTNNDRDLYTSGNDAKLIFAYGTFSTDVMYHQSNRATLTIGLHGLATTLETSDVFTVDLVQDYYAVPAVRTTYANTECVLPPGVDGSGRNPYIIGFETIVSSETMKPRLHHLVVQSYSGTTCSGIPVTIAASASLYDLTKFPDDSGMLFTHGSYNVAIHYDNPDLTSDLVDSSGTRLFYTYEQPINELGILVLGDPFVQDSSDIPAGLSSWRFHCPASCTDGWSEEITIVSHFPHMHAVGSSMHTEFYGPDDTLLGSRGVEYFSFANQQHENLYVPLTLPPGSRTVTQCTYDSPTIENFGLGSDEEMCMHFILYYPAQSVFTGKYCGSAVCGSAEENFVPESVERTFGTCEDTTSTLVSTSSETSGTEPFIAKAGVDNSVCGLFCVALFLHLSMMP